MKINQKTSYEPMKTASFRVKYSFLWRYIEKSENDVL